MTDEVDWIESNTQGRILVVDDEPKNRELLRDQLEVNGYAVIEAEDGVDALEKVASEACDVILLDVMMPRMDGLEACRQLKANPETAFIPVLMVTSLVEREERHEGIGAGANDYLTKPVDVRDVLLRVRNALSAKRLQDKVQQDLGKLRELETLRDNLTHMIVHDMRSPLMVVSLSLEMIKEKQDGFSPNQKDLLTMGHSACCELIEMVSSLLDVSRMEARKMPLNRVSCDIREIARDAAESVAVLARQNTITFSVTGASVNANVDRDITHRIFVNLLGNAIKFSAPGGTIAIDVSSAGETVRVTVTDHGHGIPPEYHQRIFEKFGQVESRKANKKYSTGLGLTFCKLAVEAQGGHIGIESEVGKGSTFWFTIPIAGSGSSSGLPIVSSPHGGNP